MSITLRLREISKGFTRKYLLRTRSSSLIRQLLQTLFSTFLTRKTNLFLPKFYAKLNLWSWTRKDISTEWMFLTRAIICLG